MDEVIYRRDAIEAVRKMQTYKLSAGEEMILVDKAEVQTELMMMPPASKEGRWLYNGSGEWHCSECGAQAPFIWMSRIQRKSQYCYNCGAKMEKGEADE